MERKRLKEEAVFLGQLLIALFFAFLFFSVAFSGGGNNVGALDRGEPPAECFEHEGNEVCYLSWKVGSYDTGVPLVVVIRPVSMFEPREELGKFEALRLAWRD